MMTLDKAAAEVRMSARRPPWLSRRQALAVQVGAAFPFYLSLISK